MADDLRYVSDLQRKMSSTFTENLVEISPIVLELYEFEDFHIFGYLPLPEVDRPDFFGCVWGSAYRLSSLKVS